VINTGGVVAATSAQMVNGKIVLDGGSGSVSVAGNLNASGKGAGQTGGAIDVNAQKIQVKATAKLDVTGDAGGGKIAIGGGGPNTRTQTFTPAESTMIAAGARLDASALTRGDGGEIVVFTSLTNPLALTQVAGSLIARGGSQGGNGGFIETSGYRLDVGGIVVEASAAKGRPGLWLLDPADVEIGASGAGSTCTIVSGDCTYLNNGTVGMNLSVPAPVGTSVTISATNSIVVNGTISWSSEATLTLAARTILLNSSITSAKGSLKLNGTTIEIKSGATLGGVLEVNATGAVPAGSSFTIPGSGAAVAAGSVTIRAMTVAINRAISSTDGDLTIGGLGSTGDVTINSALNSSSNISITATTVNINSALSVDEAGSTIRVEAPGGSINVASDFIRASTTLQAANVSFTATGTAGPLEVTATSTINLDADYAPGASVLAAPIVNWNAGWFGSNIELQTNRVNWGAAGAYSMGAGTVLTVGAPETPGTTTFNLGRDLTLQATRININNPLTWSTYRLTLNANQDAIEGLTQGVALSAALSGTNGAKLVINNAFVATGGTQTISLSGTLANQSTFTLGTGELQTDGTAIYSVVPNEKTVVIDNSGGGGGGGGSGSSEAAVVVTPVVTTTSTTAAAAAAKAAADAAAAKAIADAATANAAAIDTAVKVVVEQAITQAVATVVASTSAAVFVAPPPPPPATTTTSGVSTTTATDTTATSSSASTTTTTTAATTTTSTTTTTTATTATAGASSTAQGATVTQEFVEPLTVTTLSSTTSTVSDPGDTSVATTSTTSGPASQTATPASTATAAPAAPSLTPVAVSKDGADAGDFTLQTVKPPAPVTTAKQEARPTERTTTTPVSPGIALQATQKVPAPSGSVLGREISGSGNSSNW